MTDWTGWSSEQLNQRCYEAPSLLSTSVQRSHHRVPNFQITPWKDAELIIPVSASCCWPAGTSSASVETTHLHFGSAPAGRRTESILVSQAKWSCQGCLLTRSIFTEHLLSTSLFLFFFKSCFRCQGYSSEQVRLRTMPSRIPQPREGDRPKNKKKGRQKDFCLSSPILQILPSFQVLLKSHFLWDILPTSPDPSNNSSHLSQSFFSLPIAKVICALQENVENTWKDNKKRSIISLPRVKRCHFLLVFFSYVCIMFLFFKHDWVLFYILLYNLVS